ncbi:MAG: DUF423 domain-containing protein [Alphaproteobacteria bacterium]
MTQHSLTGLWLAFAGFFGLTGVAAGAYGWHSLGADDAIRDIFMMGVSWQLWHALALVGVAWMGDRFSSKLPLIAGIGFTTGIVLFSGTLYAFAITGIVPVEGAAPAGGVALMTGWGVFIVLGWRVMRNRP